MTRKRLMTLVLSVVVLSLSGIGIYLRLEQRARETRERRYESTLHSYSVVLKPGMTRREVEGYLRTKNIEFSQMCCVDHKELTNRVWDDLTKIGDEDAPWFCRHHSVYIAFEFDGNERRDAISQADPLDILKNMRVYHQFEVCL